MKNQLTINTMFFLILANIFLSKGVTELQALILGGINLFMALMFMFIEIKTKE